MLHVTGETVPDAQKLPDGHGRDSRGVGQYVPAGHDNLFRALQ